MHNSDGGHAKGNLVDVDGQIRCDLLLSISFFLLRSTEPGLTSAKHWRYEQTRQEQRRGSRAKPIAAAASWSLNKSCGSVVRNGIVSI